MELKIPGGAPMLLARLLGENRIFSSSFSKYGTFYKQQIGAAPAIGNYEREGRRYGDGTAYVADTTISTEQNTSGGIHVAGGGTLYAWDLDVTTNGGSAGANGADCNFTAIDQVMEGDVIWDSISELDFYMQGESAVTVTVESYETTADFSGAAVETAWEDYTVERF